MNDDEANRKLIQLYGLDLLWNLSEDVGYCSGALVPDGHPPIDLADVDNVPLALASYILECQSHNELWAAPPGDVVFGLAVDLLNRCAKLEQLLLNK